MPLCMLFPCLKFPSHFVSLMASYSSFKTPPKWLLLRNLPFLSKHDRTTVVFTHSHI